MSDNYSTDLSKMWDHSEPFTVATTIEVFINLTRSDICDALKGDLVFINGEYYETPKEQLIENLKAGRFLIPELYSLTHRQDIEPPLKVQVVDSAITDSEDKNENSI